MHQLGVGGHHGAELPVNNPAAGQNFSANPSPNAPFQLVAANFTFTSSATVATRVATLLLAGNIQALPYGTQSASETVPYSFTAIPAPTAAVISAIPGDVGSLPSGLVLPAGSLIASVVDNIQAADQFGAITLWIAPSPQAVA